MSLEKIRPKQLDLATVVKIGDIESKSKAVEILSDKSLTEDDQANMVFRVVKSILDEAIEAQNHPLEKDRIRILKKAANELKDLIEVDEQARDTTGEVGKNGKKVKQAMVAPNVTMVCEKLSNAESQIDIARFNMLNKLLTAQMGNGHLLMVDAAWVNAKKAVIYVGAFMGSAGHKAGVGHGENKLDNLLSIFSDRGYFPYDEVQKEGKTKFRYNEDDDTFCIDVYNKLSVETRRRIRKMAWDEVKNPGAVEFLLAAEEYKTFNEDRKPDYKYSEGVIEED